MILKYWRYLSLILVAGAVFYAGAHWQSGRDAATAAKIAARQALLDQVAFENYSKASLRAIKAEHDAQEANRRIYADLEPKLAASRSDGAITARRLRDALATGGRCGAVPEAPGAGVTTDTSGVAADGVEAATGAHLASCTRDAARLTALQDVVKGQM
mgnify:CR=1 FL=1